MADRDRIYTGNLRYYLAAGSTDEVLQIAYKDREDEPGEKWEDVIEDDIPLIVEESDDDPEGEEDK